MNLDLVGIACACWQPRSLMERSPSCTIERKLGFGGAVGIAAGDCWFLLLRVGMFGFFAGLWSESECRFLI